MILLIPELLIEDDVARLREIAARARFVDGRETNPNFAQKDNLQIDQCVEDYTESSSIIMAAFGRSVEFQEYTLPRQIAPPLLAKYEPGMKYGAHADVPYMRTSKGPLRSDMSCTVFVADPASYDGGELVVHFGDRSIPIKGAPGSAVVYPSTTLHEVLPVRRGQRLVAITFIESFVPNELDRWALFELFDISSLEGLNMSEANRMRLEVVRYNLTRRWST